MGSLKLTIKMDRTLIIFLFSVAFSRSSPPCLSMQWVLSTTEIWPAPLLSTSRNTSGQASLLRTSHSEESDLDKKKITKATRNSSFRIVNKNLRFLKEKRLLTFVDHTMLPKQTKK